MNRPDPVGSTHTCGRRATLLARFADYGPVTGATLFPIEIVSGTLLAGVAYASIRCHRRGRSLWVIAAVCMLASVLLFPLHFASANETLLDPTLSAARATAALDSWYAWNWVRTGLAIVATSFGCAALSAEVRMVRDRAD